MATKYNVTRALSDALKSDSALSESTYAGFVSHLNSNVIDVARIAYVVSRRGVGAANGRDSIRRLADDIGRSRSLLAQYVSQVAWLEDTQSPVTDETFGYARTLYNRGKDVRATVGKALAGIGALSDAADKIDAWRALSDSTLSPAPIVPTEPTEPTESESDTQSGTGRPNDGTAREPYTIGTWIERLIDLDTLAGTVLPDAPTETLDMIRDALSSLSAKVQTYANA